MARSFDQIVEFLKSKINSKNRSIKTHTGSVVSDIVIEGPAQEFDRLYKKSEDVSKNQSLETSDPEGTKALGYNMNKQKKSGIPSTVLITFFSNSIPDVDISIPIGTIVSTRIGLASGEIKFRTLMSLKMYASIAAVYLNPTTGKYEISTEAECLSLGVVGNVGAYTINTILGSITGIDGCYNASASSGGGDEETEDAFKYRIALAKRGNALGTEDGILNLILENEYVEDAVFVGHQESSRQEIGAIDVYVKGLIIKQFTETFTVVSETREFVFSKQPVTYAPPQIIRFANNSISTIGYNIEKDLTSNYAGSILAPDKIIWDNVLDEETGNVYIVYSYNALIETLQNLFTNTDKDLENTSLLIHWAKEILINVTFTIRILSGFDEILVKADIRNNLAEFFNNVKIGEEIQQSDVAGIIINTPGVDDVALPFTTFQSSDGTITRNVLGNLEMPKDSYAASGTITINIAI